MFISLYCLTTSGRTSVQYCGPKLGFVGLRSETHDFVIRGEWTVSCPCRCLTVDTDNIVPPNFLFTNRHGVHQSFPKCNLLCGGVCMYEERRVTSSSVCHRRHPPYMSRRSALHRIFDSRSLSRLRHTSSLDWTFPPRYLRSGSTWYHITTLELPLVFRFFPFWSPGPGKVL